MKLTENGFAEFEAVYEAYADQLYRVALSTAGSREDAEDAVQTALLRLSRQLGSLPQNEQALRAYVLTAAKHCALNLLPKRPEAVDLDSIVVADSNDPFETVVASGEYERLLSAIKSLPSIYRDVLMLRYVQQLDTGEISRLLDRPRGTIQKQITRAKALLLQIYQKE